MIIYIKMYNNQEEEHVQTLILQGIL